MDNIATESARKVFIPFQKLMPEFARQFSRPEVQFWLAKLLIQGVYLVGEREVVDLAKKVKKRSSGRGVSRSVAACTIDFNLVQSNEYNKISEQIERSTRIRLNDRVNTALIAYSLKDLNEKKLSEYIESGLLSKSAFSDILELVKSSEEEINHKEASSKKVSNQGGAMKNEIIEASLRAFGARPSGYVKLSAVEEKDHLRRMDEYHSKKTVRKPTGMSMLEAIRKLENKM